ncbi:MAG TPA: hypothetical protein VFY17_09485, partial [Pilimelia sp.]|nr:hypothetical protein [Pilimelia sp.]
LVTALEAALAGMGARRARTATPDRPYEVAEVLAPLVALGRTAGEPVRWSVPDGLYVHGHPDALAHVTLTLLANAARHAPGVPVTVDAAAAGGAVRVTVANPCTAEAGGGPGLGLRVCARMVVAEGGRMHVRPAAATPEPTWQVVVELPAAWRPDRSGA